jgi:hypothetical protein
VSYVGGKSDSNPWSWFCTISVVSQTLPCEDGSSCFCIRLESFPKSSSKSSASSDANVDTCHLRA